MDRNLVAVGAFNSKFEADLAKGALESAGIEAIIQADTIGGTRPHVAWASGGFRLLVREEDEMAARQILDN